MEGVVALCGAHLVVRCAAAVFHDVVSVRDSALYEISEAAAEEVQVSQLDQKIGRLVRNRKVATKSRVERKSQKQVHAVDTSVRVLLSSPDVTARLLAVLHRHDLATFQELLDMVLFDILRPELQDVRSTFLPRLVQAVLSLQFAEQPSLTVAAALDLLKPGTIFGELLTGLCFLEDLPLFALAVSVGIAMTVYGCLYA